MQALLQIALPVFAVIGCGFLGGRRGVFGDSGVRSLNDFVFLFALPALLFINVAEAPVERLFDWRLLGAYYLPLAALFGLAVVVALQRREPLAAASITGLCAVWSNSGHLGIPLTIFAFGTDALLPTVLVLTFDNIVVAPLALAMIEADPARRRPGPGALAEIAARLARNPVVLAVLAGVVVAASDLALPEPARGFAELLGAGAAPCALFALGAALVQVPRDSAQAPVVALGGLKLVVQPLLVWLLATRVFALEPATTAVIVLVAALPTGTSVYVFAERYQSAVARASGTIFASHVAAVLSLSVLLALLV